VRSTFRSENKPCPDHLWKLRCWKSARRCGAKHICKSTCTKDFILGPFLEVEMSKKCTPLWREAHFKVKSAKNWGVRSTFGRSDVVLRGSRRGLCTLSKVRKTWGGYVAVSTTTTTTLHYTPLHYNYSYNYNYITLLHYTIYTNYITLQHITLHYTPLHSTTPHYAQLHHTTLSTTITTLHYTNYTTLNSTSLHFTTLNYTTLQLQLHLKLQVHPITLHYTTLHYTTCITLR